MEASLPGELVAFSTTNLAEDASFWKDQSGTPGPSNPRHPTTPFKTSPEGDYTHRAKLWSKEKAKSIIEPLLANVDLVIGNEADAADMLGITAGRTDVAGGKIEHAAYEGVVRQIQQKHGCKYVAITLRESESASINHWSACLLADDEFLLSRRYTIHVVDRVGAGDAFCGGLVAALLDEQPTQQALEFAVAASCLKHTIPGDFNKVSKAEVTRLAAGDASGRVVR